MKRKLKVNDFFCGCGGMGIAFKNAGYEIAGAWNFDKYAVESYRANVGDHVQKADIKELHQADIPQADVWAFGFPCQDLSVAGKQRGMILKCEDCGEEIEINPEEYTGNTICPKCSGNNFKAASRSGCFFEIMRLLEETEREREHAMPAVIIAENVRGLRPYLPVLRLEYERHGYTAHIEMFNSKYWNVPQNRDRYAVVGTRNKKNLSFTFPKEQHEFVPKLSDYLERDVPEKYYLPDEKAQTIISQALEKLEGLGYGVAIHITHGIDFCGYIHYADHKKVRKSSIRKLKQDVKAYELGELPPEEFNRKYESRKGHLGHADTYHIAKAVEYELLFYEWERLEAAA